MLRLIFYTGLVVFSTGGILMGQPASPDPSFISRSSNGLTVTDLLTDPLNRIYVSGLDEYDGRVVNKLCRIFPDGSLDTTFRLSAAPDRSIFSLARDNSGRIAVGGDFLEFAGQPRLQLARVLESGDVDTTFDPGPGNPGDFIIYDVLSDEEGNLLIGGFFNSFSGSASRIAKLNADGSQDSTFDAGSGILGIGIYTMERQSDGKVVLAGNIVSYNGVARDCILRIFPDGTLDTTFNAGEIGGYKRVDDIEFDEQGRVLVSGAFSSVNGIERSGIVRLLPNGEVDESFNPGAGFTWNSGIGGLVNIELQQNGKIVAAGDFATYDGAARRNIVRINSDGSLDTTFDPGEGFDGKVGEVRLFPDGRILLGGAFTTYNGITSHNLILLQGDEVLSVLGPSRALRVYPNPASGAVYIERPYGIPDKFIVIDICGRQVYSGALTETATIIPEGVLTPGVYFISAGDYSGKLVVQ